MTTDPAALLDILIARGPQLQRAGYASVAIGGDGTFSAVLRPPDPPPSLPAGEVAKDADDLDFADEDMPKRPRLFDDEGDDQ